MSLTVPRITASALTVVQLSNSIKAAMVRAKEYSDYNAVTDPTWGSLASAVPAAVDANGLVVGTSFTPGDVSNAIGSINAFLAIWQGTAFNFGTGNITPNAWGQSLQKLTDAIV